MERLHIRELRLPDWRDDQIRPRDLSCVVYPLGGIRAGMICFEGIGGDFQYIYIRNRPDVFNEPFIFAAVAVRRPKATPLLEGLCPGWKISQAYPTVEGEHRLRYV